MKEKIAMIYDIQKAGIVLDDIRLFLDTHPDDTAALLKYRELRDSYEALRSRYVKKYGPLTQICPDEGSDWEWVQGPWPWEVCANVDL